MVILASSVEELEFFRFLFFYVLFYAPNNLEKKFYFLMFIHFRIYFDSPCFEVVLPREENVTQVNVVARPVQGSEGVSQSPGSVRFTSKLLSVSDWGCYPHVKLLLRTWLFEILDIFIGLYLSKSDRIILIYVYRCIFTEDISTTNTDSFKRRHFCLLKAHDVIAFTGLLFLKRLHYFPTFLFGTAELI